MSSDIVSLAYLSVKRCFLIFKVYTFVKFLRIHYLSIRISPVEESQEKET